MGGVEEGGQGSGSSRAQSGVLNHTSSSLVLKWEGTQIPSLPLGLHFLPLICRACDSPSLGGREGGGCFDLIWGREGGIGNKITIRSLTSQATFLNTREPGTKSPARATGSLPGLTVCVWGGVVRGGMKAF